MQLNFQHGSQSCSALQGFVKLQSCSIPGKPTGCGFPRFGVYSKGSFMSPLSCLLHTFYSFTPRPQKSQPNPLLKKLFTFFNYQKLLKFKIAPMRLSFLLWICILLQSLSMDALFLEFSVNYIHRHYVLHILCYSGHFTWTFHTQGSPVNVTSEMQLSTPRKKTCSVKEVTHPIL